MKRHLKIDLLLMKKNQLTLDEWALMENVYFLSKNNTGYCYASKENLAAHIGIGNRTIYRLIAKLEDRGFIEKNNFGHLKILPQAENLFAADSAKMADEPMPKWHTDSAKMAEEPMPKWHTKLESKLESKLDMKQDSKGVFDFQKFISIFPKEISSNEKKSISKIYEHALQAGADHQAIIQGAIRYSDFVKFNQTEQRFIKSPKNWLSDADWEKKYAIEQKNNNKGIKNVLSKDYSDTGGFNVRTGTKKFLAEKAESAS